MFKSEKKINIDILLKSEQLGDYVKNLNTIENVSKIIIGNGTTSDYIKENLDFLKETCFHSGKYFLLFYYLSQSLFPSQYMLL